MTASLDPVLVFAASAPAAPETPAGDTLPRWDMTPLFPALESPEFARAFDALGARIAELERLFDARGDGAGTADTLDENAVAAFDALTNGYNDALDAMRLVGSYINSFVTTDSRDALAQARQSELQTHAVRLAKLGTRYVAYVGSLPLEGLLARSAVARAHEFALVRMAEEARHLMTPAEESLATELRVTGGSAWTRLHGNVTSQLTVPFAAKQGETPAPIPMSALRTLAFDPDADTRKRAYQAELAAWEQNALPLAAAMNSIKGETNTLAARRGWTSPLDHALWNNAIDREILDAMLGAARESFPTFRRYLRAKACALGHPNGSGLPWYDLFAPLNLASASGRPARAWAWNEATTFVADQFNRYSPVMADFARRNYRENWIDAGPRPGKRDGAFCMGVRPGESRILMNYKPAFGSVNTLAHELGHAYHNLQLRERAPLQRQTPMTLAETASIFCETIVRQAALQNADPDEELGIIEAALESTGQVVVDISSRFLFEQRVLEKRQQRELSVAELCDLMTQAQTETYGDGLDNAVLHPYMWAVKGHYYGSTFYNYPYMFGLLFGLGLYAQYQQNPEPFGARYDALLADTGTADAATLAERFGINLRTPDFWRSSLAIIARDVDRFEALTA